MKKIAQMKARMAFLSVVRWLSVPARRIASARDNAGTDNQKLTNSIEYEVGSDEGEFLPENKNGWAITNIDP